MADLFKRTDLEAVEAAAARVTRTRVQRLKLQHAVLIAAIGVSALTAGMYARPWTWTWPRPEPGPAWSFERGTAVPADTLERWVLTVREFPEGKPAVFPKDGKTLSVQRNSAVRFSSTDLGGDLWIIIRRGSRERSASIPRAVVARRDAYYLNVDGDADIFFLIERRCALTIDVLRTPPGELEKDITARRGTIHSVR